MDKIIYLDNAATCFPKPDSVHNAVRDFYSSYGVNPAARAAIWPSAPRR